MYSIRILDATSSNVLGKKQSDNRDWRRAAERLYNKEILPPASRPRALLKYDEIAPHVYAARFGYVTNALTGAAAYDRPVTIEILPVPDDAQLAT